MEGTARSAGEPVVGDGALLVLGPCAVSGVAADLSATQRRLLSWLAVVKPASESIDELSEVIWGDEVPPTAKAAVRNQVSRIRSRLGHESIATAGDRYSLALATDAEAVVGAHRLAGRALAEGRAAEAFGIASSALQAWRGTPLADLGDEPAAVGFRRHLDEVRYALDAISVEAQIEIGPAPDAVPEAVRLVEAGPDDEHRWVLLVRALDRAGRRGDALAAYDRARRSLERRLGLEPGPALRAAEEELLHAGPRPAGGSGVPAVGREEVVVSIVDAMAGASIVVVGGEAGIGKSQVLGQVARAQRRTGATVAECRCIEHPATAVAVLEDLVGELGEELERGVPPVAGFVDAVRRRCQLVERVVLIVDDLHRAGPTTVSALRAAAQLEGAALVCSTSEGELVLAGLGPAALVEVPSLEVEETSQLARALHPQLSTHAHLIEEWLHRMCGGNPTMLECLLEDDGWRDAFAQGRVPDGALPTPPALRDLVRMRLGEVDVLARAAVEVAAVGGDAIDVALIEALVPSADLRRAVAAGLLRCDGATSDGLVTFRHEAVRRAVLDDLSPGRRIELHHRIAELLAAADGPVAAVARHGFEARSLDPDRAYVLTTSAGRAAASDGAYDDAALWFARAEVASSLLVDGARARVEALVGRGDALRRAGDPHQERALVDAAEAALDLGDPTLVGEAAFAALQLGVTTESGSLHEWAVEHIDRALDIVGDPQQRALVSAAAALAHSMTGKPDRCRALFEEAAQLAVDPDVRRQVLPFALLPLGHPADLDRLQGTADELLGLARDAQDPVAEFEGWQQRFAVSLQRADGAGVRESLAAMEHLEPRIGDVARRWSVSYHRAAVAHLDGDLDRAEATSEAAHEMFCGVSPSRALAAHGGQLLAIRVAQDRVSELRPAIEVLVEQQPAVPAWHAALALALAGDDPERAQRHARRALEDVPADFTWLASHLIGGRAAAHLGDPDLVARYRTALQPWSGRVCWQGTCSYGPVDAVLALLAAADGDEAAAMELTEAARRTTEALQAPVHLVELVG